MKLLKMNRLLALAVSAAVITGSLSAPAVAAETENSGAEISIENDSEDVVSIDEQDLNSATAMSVIDSGENNNDPEDVIDGASTDSTEIVEETEEAIVGETGSEAGETAEEAAEEEEEPATETEVEIDEEEPVENDDSLDAPTSEEAAVEEVTKDARGSYVSGNWTYEINSNGAKVIKYSGTQSNVSIPDSLGGYSVAEIAGEAFLNNGYVQTLTIPSKVETIGGSAFRGCSRLSTVYFNAKNCTSVGYDVFGGAGASSSSLSVIFGSGVTKIPNYLFYKWNYVAYVTYVSIPSTVTTIGYRAFDGCVNLSSISWGSNVQIIDSYAFQGCTSLKSANLPSSVTEIGDCAFCDCSNITTVTIPAKVSSIGGSAFRGCQKLSSIWFEAKNCTSVGYDVFGGAGVSASSLDVIFESGVTKIPDYLFYKWNYVSHVTTVSISETVTTIGYRAFDGCTDLTNITWGNNVRVIDDYAFQGCTSLKVAYLPDSVTEIGDCAFCDCTSIHTVDIPYKVSSIGGSAFRGCQKLSKIYFGAQNCASVGYDVFGNAGSSTSSLEVIFGSSVKRIPDYLFYKWNYVAYVTSVSIPNTVTEIGYRAFSGLEGITSLELGSNIKKIDNYAFTNCLALKKVVLKSVNTTLGYSLFDGSNSNLRIECYRGSTIANYAREEGISVSYLDLPKVTGVKLKNLSAGVNVRWSKTSGANAYNIYRKTTGSSWSKIATVNGGSTVSYVDKKVASSNGTKYYYTVKAVNGSKTSHTITTVGIIRLKSPYFTSAYNAATCKMVLKWSKNTKATGYKIQYATNKTFTSPTTITAKGASRITKTIAKLRKGNTYYVRVRSFRTSGSSTYYSTWSSIKAVKISK